VTVPKWVGDFKRPIKIGFSLAIVTAGITILLPNSYRSEARILPVETRSMAGNLGNLAAAAAAFGVSVPGGEGTDGNFVDILQSRTLREKLAETSFHFKQRSWRFGEEKDHAETLSQYLESKNLDEATRTIARMIVVNRDIKTKVILVAAETRSPELSQEIVQKITSMLEEFVQEKGRTRGSAKAIFAEARLADARRELTKAQEDFRRFLEVNRGYQSSADPDIRLRGMSLEAEYKLRGQLVTTLALSREQALLDEKNDIPILNIMDAPNLPIEKSAPPRGSVVLIVFFLGILGTWGWSNREWMNKILLSSEAS